MIRMGYYAESCNGSRDLVNNIVAWLKKKFLDYVEWLKVDPIGPRR